MASTVTCGYADSNWELNSEGENACQVYAELQGACNSSFVISTAHSTDPPYLPPNNACGCNVVAYNLMGGCAWCQTGILTGWWLTIDQWVGNCTQSMYNPTGIPSNVSTSGINIPDWARLIPSGTTWSPSQASRAAVPSSSTTTGLGFTFTTGGSSSTTTSRLLNGDAPPSNNVSYLSGGAAAGIAIGVILGIWALSTLVVVFVYFTRQNKRKAWYGPLAAFYSGNHGGAGYGPPGQAAPLMYSPHMGSYSPGHSPPISSGGYQPPSLSGATAQTHYVPPPPEGNHQTFPGAGGAPAWGGAGNTTSMYGGSQTALSSNMGGPQPAPGNGAPGPGGYRGHAEVY
ncbi:hypothetical protein M408DRAFT_328355 [Serendipita vermifera MAFF 305830]|uniref:Transmembrane protein n=1 Tax=Serendipita vermifera MAFF 305830 TaxID=933852 RepID=A0A0C3BFT9_SERVB|nr:hypothetical protein M408DRAFT_328355 [Serendipita vermifera MAFF 305830]